MVSKTIVRWDVPVRVRFEAPHFVRLVALVS
jgi:hypothetical protein